MTGRDPFFAVGEPVLRIGAVPGAGLPVPPSVLHAAPHAVARAASLLVMAAALVLAGCASGPPAGSARAPGTSRPEPARNTDRDGPPSDAPPNLASLPDPQPQVEAIRQGGPNKPYVVLGQSYEPIATDVAWKERGLASWYGTKFHGRRTASGEMFSMYGLTAAHRTLPIPSYARVRNLSNGKETIVRINDRGPFHSARVMDLSYAAAVKLGIISVGSAQVEIERLTFDDIRTGAWRRGVPADQGEATQLASAGSTDLGDDPIMSVISKGVSAPAAPEVTPLGSTPAVSSNEPVPVRDGQERAYTPNAKGFWVQLAALGKREGVDRLQQKVASELAALLPMLAVFHEQSFYKLQVGPYGSRSEAMAAAKQARAALQLTAMVVERR